MPIVALFAAVAIQASPLQGQATTLAADVDALYADLAALYEDLHRNPELGFQ